VLPAHELKSVPLEKGVGRSHCSCFNPGNRPEKGIHRCVYRAGTLTFPTARWNGEIRHQPFRVRPRRLRKYINHRGEFFRRKAIEKKVRDDGIEFPGKWAPMRQGRVHELMVLLTSHAPSRLS